MRGAWPNGIGAGRTVARGRGLLLWARCVVGAGSVARGVACCQGPTPPHVVTRRKCPHSGRRGFPPPPSTSGALPRRGPGRAAPGLPQPPPGAAPRPLPGHGALPAERQRNGAGRDGPGAVREGAAGAALGARGAALTGGGGALGPCPGRGGAAGAAGRGRWGRAGRCSGPLGCVRRCPVALWVEAVGSWVLVSSILN